MHEAVWIQNTLELYMLGFWLIKPKLDWTSNFNLKENLRSYFFEIQMDAPVIKMGNMDLVDHRFLVHV